MPTGQPSRSRLKAIVFDVDGTLYDQTRVRIAMVRQLLAFTIQHPAGGWQAIRILREFRRAQERLRHSTDVIGNFAEQQEDEAAQHVGVSRNLVRQCVRRWMERAPLDGLRRARHAGVVEMMTVARARGLKLGICSDYPAVAKLAALDLQHTFDAVVCAQDEDVQRFKPDPRGLLVAMARLGTTPEETLYVGDRHDIDSLAAERAGVASVIIARRTIPRRANRPGRDTYTWLALADALKREDL